MVTFRRILCPVDFSEPSERALRHALAIARWHESALTVLHVKDVLLGAARAEVNRHAEFAGSAHEDLHKFANDAGGEGRNVSFVIAADDAVPGILQQAKRESSDLIVMGTHGRSGLARAVLGSVTEDVIRQSACPVMTIPPSAEMPAPDDVTPFDPILCASDFSPACRKALDLAISMGQEADARLILLHALQLPQMDAGLTPMPFPIQSRIDFFEFRKDALARLKRGHPPTRSFAAVLNRSWWRDVLPAPSSRPHTRRTSN